MLVIRYLYIFLDTPAFICLQLQLISSENVTTIMDMLNHNTKTTKDGKCPYKVFLLYH